MCVIVKLADRSIMIYIYIYIYIYSNPRDQISYHMSDQYIITHIYMSHQPMNFKTHHYNDSGRLCLGMKWILLRLRALLNPLHQT